MASLHVHRLRARWKDRIRTYAVLLDGREAMGLKNGESKAIEVAPGELELSTRRASYLKLSLIEPPQTGD